MTPAAAAKSLTSALNIKGVYITVDSVVCKSKDGKSGCATARLAGKVVEGTEVTDWRSRERE